MKIQNPLLFFIGQIPFVCSWVCLSQTQIPKKFECLESLFKHYPWISCPNIYVNIHHRPHSNVTFYCRYFCLQSIRSIRFSQYENSKPLVFFHRPNSVCSFVRKYPTQIPKKFECLESLFEHSPWISCPNIYVNIHPLQHFHIPMWHLLIAVTSVALAYGV